MPFAEDKSAFLSVAEFASAASWNGVSANGLLDMPTEDVLGGRATSNEYEFTMRADEWVGISRGAQITIGDTTYRLREDPRLIDDGAFKKLMLTT